MRKFSGVSLLIITFVIIVNTIGVDCAGFNVFDLFGSHKSGENSGAKSTADNSATKNSETCSKSGDNNNAVKKSNENAGAVMKSSVNDGTVTNSIDNSGTVSKSTDNSGSSKKTGDGSGTKNPESSDDKKNDLDENPNVISKLQENAVEQDALEIMRRMSIEVVEVEDVPHESEKKDSEQDRCQSKSEQPCPKVDPAPSTEIEEKVVDVSPKPRFIRNGNGIVYKYEIDFKKPVFNIKGFRAGVAAGYITPKSKADNVKEFEHATVYTNGTIKFFMFGEFGFVKKDNSTFGVTGEVSLEIKRGNGELSIKVEMSVTKGKQTTRMEKSIGNYMKETPPICVSIPQLAGIRFCQVAFDFIFRTNFTGSACIQTEIKHLACPIPLVTVQYHCLNYANRKFTVTKTTRKSGFINPKQVYNTYSRRIQPRNSKGKATASPANKNKASPSPNLKNKNDNNIGKAIKSSSTTSSSDRSKSNPRAKISDRSNSKVTSSSTKSNSCPRTGNCKCN